MDYSWLRGQLSSRGYVFIPLETHSERLLTNINMHRNVFYSSQLNTFRALSSFYLVVKKEEEVCFTSSLKVLYINGGVLWAEFGWAAKALMMLSVSDKRTCNMLWKVFFSFLIFYKLYCYTNKHLSKCKMQFLLCHLSRAKSCLALCEKVNMFTHVINYIFWKVELDFVCHTWAWFLPNHLNRSWRSEAHENSQSKDSRWKTI